MSHRYKPFTLAVVKPWGNSKGAGRIGLTQGKSSAFSIKKQILFLIFSK